MKRYRNLFLIGCWMMAMLSGCGNLTENPYRVDTVVLIPVDPTEPNAETEPVADETEMVTEPEETQGNTNSSGKSNSSSSGKSSSSGNKGSSSGNKNSSPAKETEPKETRPPATEPPETEAPPCDPSNYGVGSLEYAVLDAINAYRAEAGAAALSLDTKLSGIAALRAREVKQVWSHSRPDGRDFASALSDYGYGYTTASESLIHAVGFDAQAMVDKWMSSDSNSGSLLNGSLATAGIGVYQSGGVTYVAAILVG